MFFFFFSDTAATEIYTLSLHDALPISIEDCVALARRVGNEIWKRYRIPVFFYEAAATRPDRDRKSTRLNSSHEWISYAVFCLKKKKKNVHSAPQSHTQPTSLNSLSSGP